MPSVQQILDAYDYDPDLHMFFFKPWGRSKVRKRAGQMGEGYIRLQIAGHSWAVHRLIWKICTGRDPVGVIDHINGVRYDNRIENLRDVPIHVNNLNKHGPLNRRLEIENISLDRCRRLAERENRERNMLAVLQAKYGCCCEAHKAANAEARAT